jgi:hypothetical protein
MPMFNLWRNWIDTGLFAAEAQCVIVLRMMRLASGHPGAAAETHRMVSEKFTALSAAQLAAGSALVKGKRPSAIMAIALTPFKRRIRKNRRRLSRIG